MADQLSINDRSKNRSSQRNRGSIALYLKNQILFDLNWTTWCSWSGMTSGSVTVWYNEWSWHLSPYTVAVLIFGIVFCRLLNSSSALKCQVEVDEGLNYLVWAGIIFFILAHMVLCFEPVTKTVTKTYCFSYCWTGLTQCQGLFFSQPASEEAGGEPEDWRGHSQDRWPQRTKGIFQIIWCPAQQ